MGSYAAHGQDYSRNGKPAHYGLSGWGMPQPWEDTAACKDTGIRIWFGDEHEPGVRKAFRTRQQTEQAKAICARCPVLDDCRRWALEFRFPFGIVGMMTETERRRLWDKDEQAWHKFWRQQDIATGRTGFNRNKIHCPSGHPYSAENTYTSGGRRFCVACRNIRNKQYQQRKREKLGHWPWQDWESTKQRRNGHKAG